MGGKIRGYIATFWIIVGLAVIICFMRVFRKNDSKRSRMSCFLFFTFNGFKLERVGEFDLEARLIIVNHQSALDIICLESSHPLNICWVAKKQLGDIPFYGHALKIPNMILIDRDDRKGMVQLLREAKDRLDKGRPVIIFPEGTRGPGDRRFLPFKPGAKILAEKLKLRVQPMVFVNTRRVYDSNPFCSTKSIARVVCLPAFTPDPSTNWFEELEKSMFDVYCKHYDELNP